MNKIKEETIKMLEEDITKLFKTIVQERTEQVKYSINNSNTDFRKYYKLFNSFINLCKTYNRQSSNESINKTYMNNLVLLINDEIKEIHNLMNKYQNLQEQYTTLSTVFNNLIRLTNELPEVPKQSITTYKHSQELIDSLKSMCKNEILKEKYNKNILIKDKLNITLKELYQIPKNTNIIMAINSLLSKYFNNNEYAVIYADDFSSYCTDLNTMTFDLRFAPYSKIKDIINTLLSYTIGYVAYIKDNKIFIKKGDLIIEQ